MSEATSLTSGRESREFHQLFIKNQRRVYAFIRTLLPDFNDAQDVFQNTCVIVLGKADQFEPGSDFAKWACQIAYFEVCNYRRKNRRETTAFSAEALEVLKSEQMKRWDVADQRHAALKNCLGKLRDRDRELLDARYCRSAPLADLAAELARPVGTIKKSLQRIRRTLQNCIERTLASEERGV